MSTRPGLPTAMAGMTAKLTLVALVGATTGWPGYRPEGPLMATGVLHAPPRTAFVQPLPAIDPPGVPAVSVECEYITSHGLLGSAVPLNTPLSWVHAAYRPPLVSMAPTTKSLVVAPNSPVAMVTWPQ